MTCSGTAILAPDCQRSRLILCLITDRRRLVSATGLPSDAWEGALLAQIEGAVAGGIDVIQIRETGLPDGDLVRLVRRSLMVVGPSRARLIVNDRLDVALAAHAHGVHLREDSIAIDEVRRLAPTEFLVGRSVHSASTAARARTADYLIAGSVFETVSKPGQAASLGLDGLRAVVGAAQPRPVWAVGGVTSERMHDLVVTGVHGVAAIGAFLPRARSTSIAFEVQKLTETLRFSLTG